MIARPRVCVLLLFAALALLLQGALLPAPARSATRLASVSSSYNGPAVVQSRARSAVAFRWTGSTWERARLKRGLRVKARRYGTGWSWVYVRSGWHAIRSSSLRRVVATGATLTLVGPATDNYKAAYNPDTNAPENRTWLSWLRLRAAGTTWNVDDGQPLISERLRVTASNGRTAYLSAQTRSANAALLSFRVGPQPLLWGLFLQLESRSHLQSTPVAVQLYLHTAQGRVLARTSAGYRYDRSLAAAPAGSVEHNGPGGRWYVNGAATRTNVQIGRD